MSITMEGMTQAEPPLDHRLSILLLDDKLGDSTGDSSVRLLESLGYLWVVPVRTAEQAVRELHQRVFDLALLDVNLGEERFGGLKVLVSSWPRLQETGTRVLVYSQEGYVREALGAFEQTIGPFRFVPKDDAFDPELGHEEEASALRRAVVEQLGVRAQDLLRQVSLRERHDAHHGLTSVFVTGRTLDVRSLLAAKAAKHPVREREQWMASYARTAFLEADRCRVLSYLFKGGSFSWPASQMYNLSRLQTYGRLPTPTSSFDALTHDPIPDEPRTATVYREAFTLASNNARADLAQLSGLSSDFIRQWTEYIEIAKAWDDWGDQQTAAEFLKKKHQFRLAEIVRCFEDRGFEVTLIGDLKTYFLTLHRRKLYNEIVNGQSIILLGLSCLAEAIQSVADQEGNGRKRVVLHILGKLIGQPVDPAAGAMPVLEIRIAHDGPPFESCAAVDASFQPGSSRAHARDALRGYAAWSVTDESGNVCEILCGETDPQLHQLDGEEQLNPSEWSVIDVIQIGIPRFRP